MSRPFPHSFGLAARLVLSYTGCSFLLLVAASCYLHRSFQRGFEIEDTELLRDHIEEVRRELARRPGDLHEAKEVIERAGLRHFEKLHGRLFDAQGRIVMWTPEVEALGLASSDFPPATAADDRVDSLRWGRTPSGQPLFLAAAYMLPKREATPWRYEVALDAGHVETWLARLRHRLIALVLVGTAATALLGWFLTRRGLRPLREMETSVGQVTATDFGVPMLGSKPWPSELAKLAAAFDDMRDRLKASFNRLSQFSADVAHEIRTPLTALSTTAGVALSRERTTEDYRQALENNLAECERLQRLVDSLLFLARGDSDQLSITPRPSDVSQLLRDTADFYSAAAEQAGLAIHCHGQGTFAVEATLLRQALSNLLSNALRHTPAPGQVTLRVTANADGGGEILLSDSGQGIAPEHLPRIFDRFYRVDEARSQDSGGTGLGLAMVKTIMNLHGGTVSVESVLGQGSKFRLVFPGTAPPRAPRG